MLSHPTKKKQNKPNQQRYGDAQEILNLSRCGRRARRGTLGRYGGLCVKRDGGTCLVEVIRWLAANKEWPPAFHIRKKPPSLVNHRPVPRHRLSVVNMHASSPHLGTHGSPGPPRRRPSRLVAWHRGQPDWCDGACCHPQKASQQQTDVPRRCQICCAGDMMHLMLKYEMLGNISVCNDCVDLQNYVRNAARHIAKTRGRGPTRGPDGAPLQ